MGQILISLVNPPNARAPSPVRGLSGLFDRQGLHMIALGCLQDQYDIFYLDV
jgi:hypothetical protein